MIHISGFCSLRAPYPGDPNSFFRKLNRNRASTPRAEFPPPPTGGDPPSGQPSAVAARSPARHRLPPPWHLHVPFSPLSLAPFPRHLPFHGEYNPVYAPSLGPYPPSVPRPDFTPPPLSQIPSLSICNLFVSRPQVECNRLLSLTALFSGAFFCPLIPTAHL